MSLHKISQERMGPPQNMPSLWQKYSSIVARWVWWMACLPNPWSVSRWPSVSLSSNLQVSEAGAIHPYPSGATRGVSATNTLFQSILHSTLLAGAAHITNIYLVVPATNRSRHLSSRQLQLTDHPSPSLTGGIREKCSSTISFGLFPVSFNLTVVFQRGGFQGFPKCWDLRGPPWLLIPTIPGGDPPMAKAQKDPYSILWDFFDFFIWTILSSCETDCKNISLYKVIAV